MHELSLIQSLLDIVDEYAARHRFEKVNCLQLSFGCMSCIDPKSLEFAFDVQSKGTKAEGARLEFDIRPAVIYCFSCEQEHEQQHYSGDCPQCGGRQVTLTGGTEELKLVEMDVD